jgi:hypothetical protein
MKEIIPQGFAFALFLTRVVDLCGHRTTHG